MRTEPEHERGTGKKEPGTAEAVCFDDMVLVGRIARPHGLKGSVVINPETDFVDERFAAGATLWTRSTAGEVQLTVIASRLQGNRPVVAFAGVGSVDQAQQLAGQELRVPETALQPLAQGRYYEHQLAGCAVVDTAGQAIGVVARVEGGAGSSRLVVGGDRGEIQIPLASDICREIDVAARRIVVEPPEGLLELNEAGSRQPAAGRERKRRRQP